MVGSARSPLEGASAASTKGTRTPKNKELTVILLDVSEPMHASLAGASTALADLVSSRMLTKPGWEVALVYFGASETRNRLADEFSEQGLGEHYPGIVVAFEPRRPGLDELRELEEGVPRGHGARADVLDALTVGADILVRSLSGPRGDLVPPTVPKRLLLLSALASRAAPDPDDAFKANVATSFAKWGIRLDTVVVDAELGGVGRAGAPPDGARAVADARAHNLRELQFLSTHPGVRASARRAASPSALAALFATRDVSASALYVGPLTISAEYEMSVKVFKKTRREGRLAPGKEVDLSRMRDAGAGPADGGDGAPGAAGPAPDDDDGALGPDPGTQSPPEEATGRPVKLVRAYFPAPKRGARKGADASPGEGKASRTRGGGTSGGGSDGVPPEAGDAALGEPEALVPAELRVRAFRYGRQLVPVPEEEERELRYYPAPALQLLGFLPETTVARSLFALDAWVVVADARRDASAATGLAALVEAMLRRRRRAIFRFIPRARSSVSLCLAVPRRGSDSRVAHLLLLPLPFEESVRNFRFSSLERPESRPAEAMREAFSRLAAAARLDGEASGGGDQRDNADGGGDAGRLFAPAFPLPRGEVFRPEQTSDPSAHALLRAIRHRALHPSAPVPEGLRDELETPSAVLRAASDAINALPLLFPGLAVADGEPEASGGPTRPGPTDEMEVKREDESEGGGGTASGGGGSGLLSSLLA